MNSDIRLAVTFPTHPKTIMLIERLGLEAVWALIRLWVFASQHRPDGVLRGLSPEAIRIACGYTGRIEEFISVLKEPATRFLDADDPVASALVLHDWKTHNPWAAGAEERSERARKLAQLRWDAERNAGRTTGGTASRSKGRNAPSPIPSSPLPTYQKASPDALRLSGILGDMILANNPGHRELSNGKRDAVLSRWAADIDKLINIDQKKPDEIAGVIRFAQSEAFWIPNILSGKKLREKFETLKMQMTKPGGGEKGTAVHTGQSRAMGIKPPPGKYDGVGTKVQAG